MSGSVPATEVDIRAATANDATALAALHAARVTEGFLPSLGVRFLTKLYQRIIRSPYSCAFVADDGARILAFAAGTSNVARLYRDFIVRDGVSASIAVAPRALRAGKRIVETLRYPASTAGLPSAEVLAVATAADAGGNGYATRVVSALTETLARAGADAVKVTVGADNAAAIAMYEKCSFHEAATVCVHGAAKSEVLVWTRA